MQAYQVDWGSLVPGRAKAVTVKRWHLMRSIIPGNRHLELWQHVRSATLSKGPVMTFGQWLESF